MFEKVGEFETKVILTPWLGVNYKVSYYSDQTKEMVYSLGINLIRGEVIEGFHESLSQVEFDEIMTGDAFHLPFIIKPVRGLERLDEAIENIIQKDDHSWAEEAKNRWKKDLEVLEHFYEGIENKPECYESEKMALEEQYNPKIKIEIINGGLFYMR
jgi:hypothetical protein